MAKLRYKLFEEMSKRNRVYAGKIVNFSVDEVSLPNKRKVIREYMEHPGAVAVLPVMSDSQVILVKQYRYPVRKALWEIPAGKLDKIKNEKLIDCVRRELVEETGYTAARVKKILSFYPTPAFATEVLHIFVASGLKYIGANPDEDEFLEVKIVPLSRAIDWIKKGRISDAKSIIALLLYERMKKSGNRQRD